jgi:type I restriction enzyme R subunit
MSHFRLLQPEWPEIYIAAAKAEAVLSTDPRTSCFYARRAVELGVNWVYQHDSTLSRPYRDDLSALIYHAPFRDLVGQSLLAKIKIIKDLGNIAVHSTKLVPQTDALAAVRELFHFAYWFASTYARTPQGRPSPELTFDSTRIPKPAPSQAQTLAQLKQLAEALKEKDAKLAEQTEEIEKIRAEVAAAKLANAAKPDTHDYSEAETRSYLIDLLLKEAGWRLDQTRNREFPVSGMPNGPGTGYVDYVLWGDNGKPLALVEAKRALRSPAVGQQQAKLYADCLETAYGQRPVIFYTNGYEHWLWDDVMYPPRSVQGFLKKDELELTIQRRQSRKSLAAEPIDPEIVGRFYQTRAIRRIAETFEMDRHRRALVVMATGAGKTRTVIALCDLLMRANWAKRILFLADRVALVNQAVKAFKAHLPGSSPVNLVTEKNTEGRVYVSTYPTMMGLIGDREEIPHRFGVGHFDLVIIDEAHRSVYQKYGAIFDYFDSLLVGLTATPRDEVDHNTYRLFDLETGVPTDTYDIDEAVKDGFLVPPKSVSVPLKFQREGIRYDDLSEEEKTDWDALEWGEDGPPTEVDPEGVNRWLFNEDTVDMVLKHLMTRGQKVAAGDRLGKTIIFAKNQDHAQFISRRFDANYPHLKGEFARVITFKTEYAQSLIDGFSQASKPPHIAISVDMLDTGIDVPEIVNLVFFKLVRSKTKFWQMIGRGTRLCKDLFGPGQDKEFFYIFDFCQNLEYFAQNPQTTEGSVSAPLSQRLFLARVELITNLDKLPLDRQAEAVLRRETADMLQQHVAAMNLENFLVRPHRRLVEKFAKPEAWTAPDLEARQELAGAISALPSSLEDPDTAAKQFDYLILRLQLALLNAEPAFARMRRDVEAIAGALAEKDAIPMVHQRMALILDVLTDPFWQDVTTPILENVRRQLRDLVKLIEREKRNPLYTDFEDELGAETEVVLPGFDASEFERFRAKARHFLRHQNSHPVVQKVRYNQPLTPQDFTDLELLLTQAGIATPASLAQAKETAEGFGLFIRSLTGMDREAAKKALDGFLYGKRPSANQVEFVNQIVDHLTEEGYMNPELLYESPYTDIHPHGVEGVFSSGEVDELVALLRSIRETAFTGSSEALL